MRFGTKITIDTFMEAGGSKEYPNLEIGGVVSCRIDNLGIYDRDIITINNKLDEIAFERGYSHIFGVKYSFMGKDITPNESSRTVNTAIGTGYKRK